ncbi:MAG: hypothetical protein JXQ90_10545 [Cyclobacteriaceae bacterium]
MKHVLNLLTVAAVFSLAVLISCKGGDDGPEPEDPIGKDKAEAMASATWVPSSVTNAGTPREEWSEFTLTFSANAGFTGGTYATEGYPSEDADNLVWKGNGTWEFGTNGDGEVDINTIYKDGDTDNALSVTVSSGASLNVAFDVPDPNNRAEGFYGEWVFNMGPQ